MALGGVDTPENTHKWVLRGGMAEDIFASMELRIAAVNGELKPSKTTETICRISLIVSLVTFIALMVATFMSN